MKSYPLCFTSQAQFDSWKAIARSKVGRCNGRNEYCSDCTPEYQRRMILEFRCAWPTTRFGVDADGFCTGYRPAAEDEPARKAA